MLIEVFCYSIAEVVLILLLTAAAWVWFVPLRMWRIAFDAGAEKQPASWVQGACRVTSWSCRPGFTVQLFPHCTICRQSLRLAGRQCRQTMICGDADNGIHSSSRDLCGVLYQTHGLQLFESECGQLVSEEQRLPVWVCCSALCLCNGRQLSLQDRWLLHMVALPFRHQSEIHQADCLRQRPTDFYV